MANAAAAITSTELNSLPTAYFQRSNTQFHAISVSTLDSNTSNPDHLSSSVATHSPKSPTTNSKPVTIKLYLAARDVPEPDSRSQANYVVLHYARDIAVEDVENGTTTHQDDLNHASIVSNEVSELDDLSPSPPRRSEKSSRRWSRKSKSRLSNSRRNHKSVAENSPNAGDRSTTRRYNSGLRTSSNTTSAQNSKSIQNRSQKHQRHVSNYHHYSSTVSNNIPLTLQNRSASVPINSKNPINSNHRNDELAKHRKVKSLPNESSSNVNSLHSASASQFDSSEFGGMKKSILTPFLRYVPVSSSLHRSPIHVLKFVAPSSVESIVKGKNGKKYKRYGWNFIGCTEIARKHGRDIEFSKSFTISFDAKKNERLMIRASIFDTPSNVKSTDTSKQRLVGVSDFSIASVYSQDGGKSSFPLEFYPISKKDQKKKQRTPDGSFLVVAQRISTSQNQMNITNQKDIVGMGVMKRFRLDVECSKIMRASALSTTVVKKVFYTVHGILDKDDENSDAWTLLSRSDPVEMIHTKRDGGSMQYNHFSGVRLRGVPGKIMNEEDSVKNNQDENDENDNNEGNNVNKNAFEGIERGTSPSNNKNMLSNIGKAFGVNKRNTFFSLPGSDIYVMDENTRLKLSVWEDNGLSAGYDLIADTLFSLEDLKSRNLGDSSAIKVHANVVGKAILKYVECSPDPKYFCLSLQMQSIQ